MAVALSILQTLLFVALLALVGQLAVGLFSWRRRHANPIYQLFALVSRPARALVRRVLPRTVSDLRVPACTFVLLCCAYLGVGFAHRSVCLADLSQAGCAKWLAARSAAVR